MPQPQNLQKAQLIELLDDGSEGVPVTVQFNPQTLKLNYSNQLAGGNQPQGSPTQFAGTSTTKLSMELWFDATLPVSGKTPNPQGDVRKLTEAIVYFMKVKDSSNTQPQDQKPPRLRFQWGSFAFTGTMESMDETIDLFSPDGLPLRASVSINLTKHDLKFEFAQPVKSGSVAAGTTPLATVKAGDSLPQLAAQAGISNWQGIAQANGITNPRILQPGTLINLSISA